MTGSEGLGNRNYGSADLINRDKSVDNSLIDTPLRVPLLLAFTVGTIKEEEAPPAKTITLDVEPSDTVENVMQKIEVRHSGIGSATPTATAHAHSPCCHETGSLVFNIYSHTAMLDVLSRHDRAWRARPSR